MTSTRVCIDLIFIINRLIDCLLFYFNLSYGTIGQTSDPQRSDGTKVGRYKGRTVQRSDGTKVGRYKGRTIQRSDGTKVGRYKGRTSTNIGRVQTLNGYINKKLAE